ncbi:aminotransferase class I/II-fold pyridoxal phosphate-dependent enzyme, partial [Candidatus Bathyarchaeota archaeon]|nr:aminotransferase class I/II-fold pyridoxal phosphate-dependent enzyme [Candidatus Bathyarchaeota archaeon]
EPHHVENLWKNTSYFKKAAEDLGFNTGNSQTPIIPIIVGESHKAKALSDRLYEDGVFVVPIVFPMVARELSRIRVQMHAKLTTEQLDSVIGKIEKIGRDLEII